MKTIFIFLAIILLNPSAYAQNLNHGKVIKTETTKNDKTTIEMTWYEDGFVKTSSRTECTSCHGNN